MWVGTIIFQLSFSNLGWIDGWVVREHDKNIRLDSFSVQLKIHSAEGFISWEWSTNNRDSDRC